ncbi:MAG: hypothetical protein DYG89_21145 [Caldilinea sp. CFX5]|nr:hypothetical protein [Caldilinea sp. CFX5]
MTEKSKEPRHQVDPVFKQVLLDELRPLTKTLQTEVEVSRLPRTIDALVTLATTDELQRVHAETPFFYFLRYNQVEFKGREDPLTVAGYHLINGRTQLYVGEQDVSLHTMTVTIICAAKPRTVLKHAETFQPFRQIAAGYYKNDAHPPIYLIVLNELPILPKNYPLLLFASSDRKFRQFLKKLIAEGNTKYLRYAYQIRPQMTREVLTMAGISTSISRKDLEFMAEDIGPDLVAIMQPEAVLKSIGLEKQRQLIALLGTKEILANMSMEQLIKDLDPAQQKKLVALVLKLLASGFADQEELIGKGSNN